MCGSFCTFSKVIPCIESLCREGYDILPIMSETAYSTDTRFGKSKDFKEKIEKITGKKIIHTVKDAEPIGPKKLLDILVVAPCTGNTIGKIANGIYDSPVSLSVKSHLRNNRPVVIAVSTNDALSMSAQNIGKIMNFKNVFFVPMSQDDPIGKPTSLVADFKLVSPAISHALNGEQMQPLYI